MKVIIKRPDEPVGHYADIPNTLESLQNAVDGHIETVYIDKDLIMIVNEMGKIKRLPVNFEMDYDAIVGTVVLCGQKGDEFDDCPISLEVWQAVLSSWGNPISERVKGVEA